MGDTYPKFKVAAVQAAPVFLDREGTTEKACRLIRAAGKEGAKVIGFPECFIPGFPHWFDFRLARECKGFIKELFKNSVEIPGPVTDSLCQAAKDAHATVVMGLNERDPGSMGTLFNTQLFIGADGRIFTRLQGLDAMVDREVEDQNVDSGKRYAEHLQIKPNIADVLIRRTYKKENSRHQIDNESRDTPPQ